MEGNSAAGRAKMPDMTLREARYVNAAVNGESDYKALRQAGWSHDLAAHPARVITEEMRAEVERLRGELVANTIQTGLADAIEIHESLTDELRGDLAELYNPRSPLDPRFNPAYEAGKLMAIEDWPLWARQGGVEVTDDPDGLRVRAGSRAKAKELLMKHRGVDAMVQPTRQAETDNSVTVTVVHVGQVNVKTVN